MYLFSRSTRTAIRSSTFLCLLALMTTWAPTAANAATTDRPPTVSVVFEGEQLDLSQGWGGARACLVSDDGVECFRTIAELDKREEQLSAHLVSAGAATAATCSTPLRLYDGYYQTGAVLSFASRGIWLNLSTYGFDNRTSSYRVGSCNVELASSANGGGSHYSWCLSSYCVENVMKPGWNNVVSSVYNK